MTSKNSVDLAVHGVVSKASAIARTHGRYAYGHEAKVLAEFIATEIEHLDDPLYGWAEREAGRLRAANQQARDEQMQIVDRLRAGPLSGDPVFEQAADEIERLVSFRRHPHG